MIKVFNKITSVVAIAATATVGAVAEPVAIEKWAIREVVQNVRLSPDGEKIAFMRNDSRTGNPIVEIRDVDNLSNVSRFNAKNLEITNFRWISDDLMTVGTRDQYYKRIRGFNQGTYLFKTAVYNVNTKEFDEIDENTTIANILPEEPNHVLLSKPNANSVLGDDDPFDQFRPRSYYRSNLKTGSSSLVFKGNDKIATAFFDRVGNPRAAAGYDRATREFTFYYRPVGGSGWNEIYRQSGYDYAGIFNPVAFPMSDSSIITVVSNHDNDLAGVYEFDTATKQFGRLLYRPNSADAIGVRTNSNPWEDDKVVGYTYLGEKVMTHWVDTEEENFFKRLELSIPNAHQLSITSMSRDGSRYTVFNNGPKDPGSHYLVVDGALQLIGKHNPLLTADDLSEVRYIKYPARDGRMIPGYVTIPKGDGPHPLIVLPHGGPYVSEVITFDEWGQFLANNGYMVLQPQYRGSRGHGKDHYLATINEHGLKMQDDKDDGALHLVREGLADPDRLAMFGWSYGGYAALVAATRENNIYQCSIAGAPVSDPTMQFNYYRNFLRDFDREWEEQRRSGISPVNEVEKINIPLMFIHGSVDQRVPFDHYEVYERAVKKAGKEDMVEFVVLDMADHFYNTLFFEHQEKLYTTMRRFLQEDCGPGGL